MKLVFVLALVGCGATAPTHPCPPPAAPRAVDAGPAEQIDRSTRQDGVAADDDDPDRCRQLLAPLVTPYPGGLRSAGDPRLEKLGAELEAAYERCDRAYEQTFAGFTIRATVVSCKGIRLDGQDYAASEGPLVDDFCCGVDRAEVRDEPDGTRLVRAHGYGAVRVCSGGTASETPDAVYRIAGGKLELIEDHSVTWH